MARKKKAQISHQYGVEIPPTPLPVVLPRPMIVPIGDLLPRYARREDNPNKLGEDQFALLCAAIKEEGFLQPILVTELAESGPSGETYRIEDGHHRWWAAREVGLASISIVLKEAGARAFNEHEARARLLGIGMNRIRGEVDLTVAAGVIAEVQAVLDLQPMELSMLTGFSTAELDTLLASTDDVPDLLKEADEIPETGETDENPVFVLEINFTDRKAFTRAKKQLRKTGKGDLAAGLLALLGEEEAS